MIDTSIGTIRLHRLERTSRANGPGVRMVLWTQGCAFACPGCFNPETHDLHSGENWNVQDLLEEILRQHENIQGLTLSGGEPLYQRRALAELLELVRARTSLSVLVFTGYRWEELQKLSGIQRFLASVDVLLAGRYDASRRVASGLIGSSNKTTHFLTGRYTEKDLREVPQAEVILAPDGEIRFTGIDPLTW